MPVKIVTLPFDETNETFHEEMVNRFISGNIIKKMKFDFFSACERPYWSIFMEYEPRFDTHETNEVEKMSGDEKALLEKLFELRRQLAEKEGIPVFIIATNKQLRDVVKQRPTTGEQLKMIDGFGKKKTQKYGRVIFETVKAYFPKISKDPPVQSDLFGESNSVNSQSKERSNQINEKRDGAEQVKK